MAKARSFDAQQTTRKLVTSSLLLTGEVNARIRVPISNFQYGEISPSLVSRTDTCSTTTQQRLRTSFCVMRVGCSNVLAPSAYMSLTLR